MTNIEYANVIARTARAIASKITKKVINYVYETRTFSLYHKGVSPRRRPRPTFFDSSTISLSLTFDLEVTDQGKKLHYRGHYGVRCC